MCFLFNSTIFTFRDMIFLIIKLIFGVWLLDVRPYLLLRLYFELRSCFDIWFNTIVCTKLFDLFLSGDIWHRVSVWKRVAATIGINGHIILTITYFIIILLHRFLLLPILVLGRRKNSLRGFHLIRKFPFILV